jgi:hypothetical protein
LAIYDVNILDGNGNLHWTKKIAGGSKITKEFLSSGPRGAFKIPTMSDTGSHTYEFMNEWYINSDNGQLKPGSSVEATKGWPIFEDLIIDADVTLIPRFDSALRKYKITFTGGTGDFYYSDDYDYGTLLKDIVPSKIPYKDDSELNVDRTYTFVGYSE